MVLARPLKAPSVFPRESSGFAALLKRIIAKKAFECIGQIIVRCKFVEKRAKNMLPKVRVAADSKLCCPLASFRPRRSPNLASSLIAVPSDANLTVREMVHRYS